MKFFLFIIWFILEQICEIGFTRPIYWEMRLKEVRRPVQNHTAGKKLNLHLNPDFLTPETRLFVGRGENSVNKGTNCQLCPKSWPLKGASLHLLPSLTSSSFLSLLPSSEPSTMSQRPGWKTKDFTSWFPPSWASSCWHFWGWWWKGSFKGGKVSCSGWVREIWMTKRAQSIQTPAGSLQSFRWAAWGVGKRHGDEWSGNEEESGLGLLVFSGGQGCASYILSIYTSDSTEPRGERQTLVS